MAGTTPNAGGATNPSATGAKANAANPAPRGPLPAPTATSAGPATTTPISSATTVKPVSSTGTSTPETQQGPRKPISIPATVRATSTAAASPAASNASNALPNPDEVGERRIFREPGKNLGGPVTKEECEFWLSKLQDEKLDLSKRAMIASELRDNADASREPGAFAVFLNTLIPPITAMLLETGPPVVFFREPPEQRFRNTLLAFLQRLPRTEPLKPHESSLMSTALSLLKVENEDNALLCIKIIIDGFRSHKEQTEQHVQPFLNLVKEMYANIKEVVENEFGKPGTGDADTMQGVESAAPIQPQSQPQTPVAPATTTTTTAVVSTAKNPASGPFPASTTPKLTPLPHALKSPKVLTECPIAVVLIFQSFRQVMQGAMKDFYPLVMDSIALQPEPQRKAYQAAEEKGQIFTGVADGIHNREMYTEIIKAQVKTMAFLAYVLRGSIDNIRNYLDIFPEACVRLLRDCPPEDVATRKELLIATRHMLSSDFRTAFVPFIDMLLDEKVLVGSGVTSREALRPLAYSTLADLIHHVRNDLSLQQLVRVIAVYGCISHDSTFPFSIQTMCSKLTQACIESICNKGDKAEAVAILQGVLLTTVEKLKATYKAFDRMKQASQQDKTKTKPIEEEQIGRSGFDAYDWRSIERAMPVLTVAYASDSLETFVRDAKTILRSLFNNFRSLFNNMRVIEAPPPQGDILGDLFRYGVLSLQIYEGGRDTREEKDAIEQLGMVLVCFDPHVYSEVWTSNLSFYCKQLLEGPNIITLLQNMLVNNEVSHQTVGILLKYLMNNLESIGTQSKIEGALSLKLFKLSFMAVNQFIELNEPVLVPYLSKLIIDSFAYAAKAEDPSIYYQVLRALFRSIGGGRFEALYKEVLPILEEMLETLNYLLRHAEPSKRDLFVELCLTVPVRLTNLLPHLGYLMHPLVHALNSGPDLIGQGLRTLELCIDNLTSEFLDPTLDPVLRELMTALYNLLKPVPFNHQHAHSAVKILGKLGGRNRKFSQTPYLLEFHPMAENIVLQFDIEGQEQDFKIATWVDLAVRHVRSPAAYNRENAVTFLKQCSLLFVSTRYHSIEQEPVLRNAIKGLFDATLVEDQRSDVIEHIRLLAHEIFRLELGDAARKQQAQLQQQQQQQQQQPQPQQQPRPRKSLNMRPSSFIQSIILAMADGMVDNSLRMKELFEVIVHDLLAQKKEADDAVQDPELKDSGNVMIQMLFSRALSLCFEEDWDRKLAGCAGLDILRTQEALQGRWLAERKLDYVRGLFFVLRDAPKDIPRSLDDVATLLKEVIRQSNADPQANPNSMSKLIDMLVLELPSQKTAVRDASKECIAILAEIQQVSVHNLISSSAKERLLDPSSGPIFNKPLRALPFGMQIGNIDAITYLLNLTPSLPEVNEELNRLFHETIALADADDASLIGRQTHHALEVSLRSLRVACLKLLCAAMNCADLFANNQNSLRSRIISVYFKHMYSASPQIVEVAHEGLRRVLAVQSKLPKDLLQQGLRPILVNLADARRLSVSGLEGLARFLELLTNYFKVEIGVKLLDHFKSLAEPAMLQNAAARPYEDNQDIARMVRLVNIFRLLPPTANTFLRDLTEQVSEAEAKLMQSRPGPFSENLALYFDKYPEDATNFLLERLDKVQLVRTYRHTLASGKAPKFVTELSDQADKLCELCFRDQDKLHLVLPGIQIIDELSATSDDWLSKHVNVLQALVSVWRSLVVRSKGPREESYSRVFSQEPTLILKIFIRYLEQHQDIELLFHVVEAFEIQSAVDRSDVTDFLYRRVAASDNLQFKRDIFTHFLDLYANQNVSSAFKKNALRYIINPLLWLNYSRRDPSLSTDNIIVKGVPSRITAAIWHPLIAARHGGEDSLHIELLHMSAILVHYCPDVVGEVRKDIIMVAWESIRRAGDATVKHMAYLLAGRFFHAYESPSNIVRPTWHGLLRVKETEGRTLYRQAINVVARCLPKRDPPKPDQISWAAATKKVLTEEGNATPQLVSVCELLVGNPDLFYNSRDLFVSLMANSLTKLGFVPAATADMKKLTIDIVELIFRWERRRLTGAAFTAIEAESTLEDSKKRPSPGETPAAKRQKIEGAGSSPAPAIPGSGWQLPVHVRELITSYIVRLVSTSPESISRGGLTHRAVQLLREIIGPDGLPGVTVKLSFFQRTMAQDITEANYIQVSNSAEVIAIVATSKDMDWIKAHLGTLTKLLESAVLSDFSPLHDTLRPILEKMFACLPAPSESGNVAETLSDDLTAFQNWAENIANSLNKPDKVLSAKDRLQGPLFVLQCYIKARPERLEASAAAVVKLITKLTLDLTGSNLPSNVYENAHRSAIAIMELCRGHLAQLKDQRRPYLGALHHLIEHCTSIPMCRYILDMLRDWTLIKQDPLPAYKEKAGLLNRMTTYESRRDEASGLYHDYLQLILDIFQEPSLARSDLTNRLEGAFLIGTRCSDPVLRSKFVAMLEKSLPTDIPGRLRFILATQNWEHVAGTYWMTLATDLLYGCIERSQPLVVTPPSISEGQGSVLDTHLDTRVLIRSFRALLPLDNALVDEVWADAFQSCWSTLDRPLQVDVQRWFTGLICKEHHMEQVEKRPNGIQTLFRGALACGRSFLIPPLVIKYFGKTFGAWHTAMELLSMGLEQTDAEDLRDGCADALTELYAELSEDDLFYGLWRRRCLHDETNAGLALEQNGLWPRAQEVYEQAQTKVRNGVIPYTENEYNVWQDHWIIAAQKLQQWDILTDLARHENNHDLLLECAWRLSDWGSQDREMIERTLDAVSDVPTPRRKVFQAYTCLIKAHTGHEDPSNFLRVLDEAIQLSMRKWCSLPTQLSAAHIPLLQMFQQYVELQEAAGVFESLSQTNRETLEARVTQDLKPIFQTWRERLPNFWDDISVWSDILAWRQHVFSAVTKVYSPLINANEPGTYGFRGFHETAWTINRFGHVARKHGLSDVCLSALGKIYALPNIEISEAFLKLREQALCLFQRPERFAEGLESISTTNLMYFANNQKAEFLTLKGMFVAKLGRENEANIAFAQAVQVDLNLPKAWAEWGRWNDRLFKERPVRAPEQPEPEPGKPRLSEMQWQANYAQERMGLAANAVSCYLQAAGLYKSAKARKLLVRVLWLLGVDDSASTVSRAFESYTGDVAIWYWITLIPQLLLSLTHREARHARNILMKIAKNFPQALFYHLRTSKEDFTQHHKNQQHARQYQAKRMNQFRAQHLQTLQLQQQQQQQQQQQAAQAQQQQQQQQQQQTSAAQTGPAAGDSGKNTDMEAEQRNAPRSSDAVIVKQEAIEAQPKSASDGSGARAPNGNAPAEDGTTARPADAPKIDADKATPDDAAPPGSANTTASVPQSANAGAALPTMVPSPQVVGPGMPNNMQAVMQMSRQPQELLEEILNILKTAFPLLALSMEKMVDHINVRTKPPVEEDCYRFLSALLHEAISTWTQKVHFKDDELIPVAIRDKVRAFCAQTKHDLRQVMYEQFVQQPITLREYITRLQKWQQRYEIALDARPRREQLDHGDCLLSDFHHSKFDDVEIPGQYIEHVDSNNGFAKITRFAPTMVVARGFNYFFRRITMLGTNGGSHTFAVQSPSGRHCRREERLTQLFRILNTVLQKRKESRKRNLSIHLPGAVPLTPTLRLVTSDNSYISLQDVFDEHCRRMDMFRDKPMLEFIAKWRQIYVPSDNPERDRHTVEYKVARMELVEEVAAKYVPENILTNYMIRTMSDPSSLWLMRKHFALQTASTVFLSYVACLSNRNPNRFHFSLKTGLIFMTELFATFDTQRPGHKSNDAVPFRLTPNMQHFITPAGIEGLLTSGVMAMARSLSNPEFDLESSLSLFLRDEISLWFTMFGKPSDHPISVLNCSAGWVQRCSELAYTGDIGDKNEVLPITQVITSLICQATNTQLLASTNPDFQPWF